MQDNTEKKCEVCLKDIPSSFQNLLCGECYDKQVGENEQRLADEQESRDKMGLDPVPSQEANLSDKSATNNDSHGIKDPNYKENPQMDDKPQWEANIVQFAKSSLLLWKATRYMYTYIKDYMMRRSMEHPQYPKLLWKPTVVDVGCGSGVGANVLSQEADFVWGIDKNKKSIAFAKEAFERQKNGIYYSAQLTFDNIDILEDTREYLKFDIVVCIEIIEHIYDYKKFLYTIIKKFAKKTQEGRYDIPGAVTEFFISTPNRNNKTIMKDKPQNKYHVREFTQEEFIAVLSDYFGRVEIMNAKGEPVGDKTDHTPILARCSLPKI